MALKLFRKQATQAQQQKLFGDVLLTQQKSFKVIYAFIALVSILIALFLVFGEYNRKETVIGHLVPDHGVVKVYASFSGIIDQIFIQDSQQVEAGQELFKLQTDKFTSNNQSISDELKKQLANRKQNILEKIKNEEQFYFSEMDRYQSRISGIENEILNIKKQIKVYQELVNLSKKQLDDYKNFYSRNIILEAEVNAKESVYLSNKASLENNQRLLVTKKNELNAAHKQIIQIPQKKKIRLLDLENSISQINERLSEINSSQAYIVRAPIAGRITSIQVNAGQSMTTNQWLLTIIPNDMVLHAELFLPSRAIGFVTENKKVLLRYDAFPYQRYGLHKGIVSEISVAAAPARDYSFYMQSPEPVYKVKVTLEKQLVNAFGKNIALQPGMTISADILLEKRSILEWLLEPVLSFKGVL
jgi:membrane fusion protein